jgi:hypothetical protein
LWKNAASGSYGRLKKSSPSTQTNHVFQILLRKFLGNCPGKNFNTSSGSFGEHTGKALNSGTVIPVTTDIITKTEK